MLSIVLLQWYYTDLELNKTPNLDFVFLLLFFSVSLTVLVILSNTINFKFILKILLLFVYFGIVSFFLQLAINLNNSNFDLNTILDYPFSNLICLIVVIVVSFLIRQITKFEKISFFKKVQVSENQAVIILLLPILNQKNQLIVTAINFFKFVFPPLSNFLLINILIGSIITIFLSFCLLSFFEGKNKNLSGLYLAILSSVLLSTFYNYFIQSGVKLNKLAGATSIEFMIDGAIEFQTYLIFIISFLVYLVINRYFLSTIANVALWSIVTFANYSKFQLRNEPLLLTDLSWLSKISFILKFVEPKILLSSILLFLLVVGIYLRFSKFLDSNKIIHKFKYKVFAIIPLLVLPYSLCFLAINDDSDSYFFAELRNRTDYNWLGFSVNSRFKSVTYLWAQQYFSPLMAKPYNYSGRTIEEIVKKYVGLSEEFNEERTNKISEQTVIFVLSESFINPERLSSLTISKPIVPNFLDIVKINTGGTMKSDGYGGGTANMEFQSLTGLPLYIFSGSISVANTEVFPKLKYIPILSNEFNPTNRIVIHPDSATNYNRNNIYNQLDFSKFIAKSESKDVFSRDEVVGLYPSDQSVYQTVIEEISESESQFFSVITMQNHAPYSANGPLDIIVTGKDFSNEENNNVTNYARLLNYTDTFTKEFLDKLKEINKNITVVFYGDHLPGIFPGSTFTKNPESQFETDYFIWSNFKTIKKDYSYVNSSDLTAVLLDHTNSKLSPYYALLTKAAQVDISYKKQSSINESEFLSDLELVQYDLTEGKGYILKHPEFFDFK